MRKVLAFISVITLLSSCLYDKPATFVRKGEQRAKTVRVETRTADIMMADLEEGVNGEMEPFEALCSEMSDKLSDLITKHDTLRIRIYASRLNTFRVRNREKLDDLASHSTEIMELMMTIDNLPVSLKLDEKTAYDTH